MKNRLLILFAAVLALAAFPVVVAAHGVRTFSASSTIVRSDAGTAGIDPSTGGLLTTGQVFNGSLSSTWKHLEGAAITVGQNSLIGVDPVALATTGTSPLYGQAWGDFSISAKNATIAGSYSAELSGTLYLDPFGQTFGCEPTSVFGPIDVTGDGAPDAVGAYVTVTDNGAWQVTADSATGRLKQIDEIGGMLLAMAGGCLEGDEAAQLTMTGQLVGGGDDDQGNADDHGKGGHHGKGNGDDHGKGSGHDDDRGKGNGHDERGKNNNHDERGGGRRH